MVSRHSSLRQLAVPGRQLQVSCDELTILVSQRCHHLLCLPQPARLETGIRLVNTILIVIVMIIKCPISAVIRSRTLVTFDMQISDWKIFLDLLTLLV